MYKPINIGELFNAIYAKLSSPHFGEGLAGELPIYIQPTPIAQLDEVKHQMPLLLERLRKKKVEVLEINLYDLCCEMLEEADCLNEIFEVENDKDTDREAIIETLSNIFVVDDILDKIKYKIKACENSPSILLFTGVAQSYPMLRSHLILNNIQSLAGPLNIVLFFPGKYNNQHLSLFNRINDENYYRAHNLEDMPLT